MVKVDCLQGCLAIEARSDQSMEHSFSILDLKHLKLTEVTLPIKSDWWLTLLGLSGGHLILGQYKNQKNPGPITLWVYDWIKQVMVQEIDHFQLNECSEFNIYGKALKGTQSEEIHIKLNNLQSGEELSFPETFKIGSPSFDTVAAYLNTQDRLILYEVAYLEIGYHILMNYYYQDGDSLNKSLVWLANEQLVIHEDIDQNMKGISSESFIVLGKKLIFVSNRNNLKVYYL